MSEKVAVFIDGSNFFHGLIEEFGKIEIDFSKLITKLIGDRHLMRAYYYTALPDQKRDPDRYKKQQQFTSALQRKDYFKVVFGRLEPRGNTYVEKGVDISLAVDMIDLAFQNVYDTGILITGDGDMAKAIEVAQHHGKHIEVACMRSMLSNNLSHVCDKFICLDREYLIDCWR